MLMLNASECTKNGFDGEKTAFSLSRCSENRSMLTCGFTGNKIKKDYH